MKNRYHGRDSKHASKKKEQAMKRWVQDRQQALKRERDWQEQMKREHRAKHN